MTGLKSDKSFFRLTLVLLAMLIADALLIAAPLSAQDDRFNMKLSTSDIRTGDSVFGQKPPTGWLKGRVVLVEFWGIQCPPCLASMP
jgi:thiol-disulfide isomerase/thioredoxin